MQATAEWLEADGQGGFASGTIDGIRTRRYHALLLAAASPPGGRMTLVNGLECWIDTASGRYPISSARYAPDTIYPDGRASLVAFDAVPWPRWRHRLPDGTTIEHELFVSPASAETVLRWRADRPARLTARPMLSGRDYHALHHENAAIDPATVQQGDTLVWRPYEGVPAITARGNFSWHDAPDWFRNVLYTAERDRGLDDTEDLFSPGWLAWDLADEAVLMLRSGTAGQRPAESLVASETARRSDARAVTAESYQAARGSGQTLLAGFPWFTDWGRDTFIAMRGLLIGRGRLPEAASILLAWSDHVSEGMLPNRFPDDNGQAEYNAVDASLWFAVAVHELGEAGGLSKPVAQRLRTAVVAILEGYTSGTRYGIGVDPADGLLRAGVPGVPLTWMDARVDGRAITPRIGKPIEVQALWVNALAIAGRWNGGNRWMAAALKARDSVLARFPDRATGGLYDVVDVAGVAGAVDSAIRPNQLIAAGGLPIPVLTPRLTAGIVALAEARLLTPLGLRTLAPDDPSYCGRYAGGPASRDAAYHQGTAWPWLLGPFVAAWLAVRNNTADARAEGRRRFLPPLRKHLQTAGLGHLSEVVDGDAPHTPGGCPFQAWSLGELIRIETMLGAAHGA